MQSLAAKGIFVAMGPAGAIILVTSVGGYLAYEHIIKPKL
jgi:hypothetical protein